MLKKILLFTVFFFWHLNALASDLLEVYQQALYHDPIFQQAIAKSLVTKDNVPISISYLLPNISVFTNPTVSRYGFSGTEYRTGSIGSIDFFDPRNLTQRTYTLDLSIKQAVFNFGLYANVLVQLENAKSACALLNAALQDLMVRVSKAYFAVLRDEEELTYTLSSKRYYQYQLQQVNDQYQAGIKNLTDVYTAKAAYESSDAAYIVANKRLANDKENLRAITNVYYPHLSYLKNDFPLISPQPNNIESWVKTALMQNWSIKAAQYSLEAARQNIKQQYAGHFPTVSLEANFARNYTYNINGYPSYIDSNGPGTISDRSIGLSIDIPIYEGGGVTSKTLQAKHFYEEQFQVFDTNVRTTVNNTRQSFMNIVATVSQLKADRHVINAAVQSLQGTLDRYYAGVQTLLDVLNREELLYDAQITYATDRYDYINNVLLLKEAAGTLRFEDICAINSWLTKANKIPIVPFQDTLLRKSKTTIQQNRLLQKHEPLVNKAMVQNQGNIPLNILLDQMREENRQTYKKLETQNQQSSIEIAKLKSTLMEVKQDLQNKDHQLQIALKQISETKKK